MKFTFDAPRSKPSKADIDKLYDPDIDHPSNEDYLRYVFPQFKEMATGPDGERKDWLKRFLDQCDNTAEKRALQALLTDR